MVEDKFIYSAKMNTLIVVLCLATSILAGPIEDVIQQRDASKHGDHHAKDTDPHVHGQVQEQTNIKLLRDMNHDIMKNENKNRIKETKMLVEMTKIDEEIGIMNLGGKTNMEKPVDSADVKKSKDDIVKKKSEEVKERSPKSGDHLLAKNSVMKADDGCPDGFVRSELLPFYCYRLVLDGYTWFEAYTNCKLKHGADLVYIESQMEQELLEIYIKNLDINWSWSRLGNMAWIGLSKEGAGEWAWSRHGAALNYTNWAYDPSPNSIWSSCASMRVTGVSLLFRWFDMPCNAERNDQGMSGFDSLTYLRPSICKADYKPPLKDNQQHHEDKVVRKSEDRTDLKKPEDITNIKKPEDIVVNEKAENGIEAMKSEAIKVSEALTEMKKSKDMTVKAEMMKSEDETELKSEDTIDVNTKMSETLRQLNNNRSDELSIDSLVMKADAGCPDGFVRSEQLPSYCYRLVLEGYTWSQAYTNCKLIHGADLVYIESQLEQDLLETYVKNLNIDWWNTNLGNSIWIGLSKEGPEFWQWSKAGVPYNYSNWAWPTPDSIWYTCTSMVIDTFKWYDVYCTIQRAYDGSSNYDDPIQLKSSICKTDYIPPIENTQLGHKEQQRINMKMSGAMADNVKSEKRAEMEKTNAVKPGSEATDEHLGPDPAIMKADSGCPRGFVRSELLAPYCYQLVAEGYTWFEAYTNCKLKHGADLVYIESQLEQNLLAMYVKTLDIDWVGANLGTAIWIGLYKEGGEAWRWSAPGVGVTYNNWRYPTPDSIWYGCAYMRHSDDSFNWYDTYCTAFRSLQGTSARNTTIKLSPSICKTEYQPLLVNVEN